MTLRRPVYAALSLALLAGCATGGARSPAESVTKLEAERAKNPNSAAALRALGIAYFNAQRYPEARDALAAAEQALPNDGVTALHRGLTAEAMGDLTGSRRPSPARRLRTRSNSPPRALAISICCSATRLIPTR